MGRWLAGLAVLLMIGAWIAWQAGIVEPVGYVESVHKGEYFFRIKASLTADGEPLEFDVVIACKIAKTRHRDGDSSVEATFSMPVYVKRTKDGHAVSMTTPSLCQGETTDNGKVPPDFNPGFIWFEAAGDYRFGIGYLSDDAFKNPKSRLTYQGASVRAATWNDWKAFQPALKENLIDAYRISFFPSRLGLDNAEMERLRKDHKLASHFYFPRICRAFARYELTERGRELVRKHWPAHKPEYWTLYKKGALDAGDIFQELIKMEEGGELTTVGGHKLKNYFSSTHYNHRGFASRAGGGNAVWSKFGRTSASDIFPLSQGFFYPWVLDPDRHGSVVDARLETDAGRNLGFAYCGAEYMTKSIAGVVRNMDYWNQDRKFICTIDGKKIENIEKCQVYNFQFFFKGDTFLYRTMEFSL